jgi:hypothetical protein
MTAGIATNTRQCPKRITAKCDFHSFLIVIDNNPGSGQAAAMRSDRHRAEREEP